MPKRKEKMIMEQPDRRKGKSNFSQKILTGEYGDSCCYEKCVLWLSPFSYLHFYVIKLDITVAY